MRILILSASTLLLATGLLFAQGGDGPKTLLKLDKHDMTKKGTTGTVVCEYCHAPHKLATSADVSLLWNAPLKAGPYNVYGGSSTMDATPRDPSGANKTSRNGAYMSLLCLSCHDGAITVASLYNQSKLGTAGTSIAGPNIGSNSGTLGLGDDHPVDFVWTAALATNDGGIASPTLSGTKYVMGRTTPLPLFKDTAASTDGTLQCATCHNPHDNTTNSDFLRASNASSALCLNCH